MTVYAGVASRDGVVLGVNQAPLQAAGLQISDVMGRQVWDTYWWSYSQEMQHEIRALLQSVVQGDTVRRELMGRMKDEQLVAVDCSFSPLRNAAGGVVAVVGTGVDVSARKNASGLAEGELPLFRPLFDKTRDLIYIADAASGRLVDVNEAAARRLGYTRDELLQLNAAAIA